MITATNTKATPIAREEKLFDRIGQLTEGNHARPPYSVTAIQNKDGETRLLAVAFSSTEEDALLATLRKRKFFDITEHMGDEETPNSPASKLPKTQWGEIEAVYREHPASRPLTTHPAHRKRR